MKRKPNVKVLFLLTSAIWLGCGGVAPEVDEVATQSTRSALTLSEGEPRPRLEADQPQSPSKERPWLPKQEPPLPANATEHKDQGCHPSPCPTPKESKAGNPGGHDPIELKVKDPNVSHTPTVRDARLSVTPVSVDQASTNVLGQAP